MQNASKALIIAGAILLSILIIGLGMFIYQQASGAMQGVGLDSQQVDSYNSTFTSYEGTQSGTAVRSLCDRVRSHNNTQVDDTTLQVGIQYGGNGLAKTQDNIDEAVTVEMTNAVKSAIRSGKRYRVDFNYGDSGMIVGIIITDYEGTTSGT